MDGVSWILLSIMNDKAMGDSLGEKAKDIFKIYQMSLFVTLLTLVSMNRNLYDFSETLKTFVKSFKIVNKIKLSKDF